MNSLTAESFRASLRNSTGEEKKFLVAVSGGVDSVILANLMNECGLDFGIVHINYRLRGEESEGDAAFVSQLAQSMKKTHFEYRLSDEELADLQSGDLQQKARAIRYTKFHELATRGGYDFILTAHHGDDQAETILFHFIRGSGPSGLGGMRSLDGRICRPLLSFTRYDLLLYAQSAGLTWREDTSNASTRYTRNRLRHEILPVLDAVIPGISERLNRLSPLYQENETLLREVMRTIIERIVQHVESTERIALSDLSSYPYPRLLLLHWLAPHGFSRGQTEQAFDLIETSPGTRLFGPERTLWRERDALELRENTPPKESEIILTERSFGLENEYGISFEKVASTTHHLDPSPLLAQLDASRVEFPLIVRPWKTGDRLVPLGMSGTQLVSDILTQRKVPSSKRADALVVVSGEEIIWVVGHRISAHHAVSPNTQTVLILRVNETP